MQLMPPGVPRLRKAMQEHDQRSGPGLDDVHADAVGIDGAVLQIGHAGILPEV